MKNILCTTLSIVETPVRNYVSIQLFFCFAELDSVMMTPSGFISPAREGRLPESRTPVAASSLVQQHAAAVSRYEISE